VTSLASNREVTSDRPLRLILLCHYRLGIYDLAMSWAARHGYSFKLVVTSPGPAAVRSTEYQKIVAAAPPDQDILVTTHPKRLARYIAPLKPDLILAFGWWYRVPDDVLALPRLGTVNFHDALLPRYRGSNATPRAVYDGQPLGVTAHWVDSGLDTGPILFQKSEPLPDDLSPESIGAIPFRLVLEVMEEGLARAIAGDPGVPQNSAEASFAGPFTDEEKLLDWNRPKAVLLHQVAGLKLAGETARVRLDSRESEIDRLEPLDRARPDRPIGSVLSRDAESATVVVADGVVRLQTRPAP
jgi:methionyl-tRNA formyltransferase